MPTHWGEGSAKPVTDPKTWTTQMTGLGGGGSHRYPRWTAYALALAITFATLLVRLGFGAAFDERPLLVLFILPIIISSHFGGLGPGLCSTALSVASISFFITPPMYAFSITNNYDLVQWLLLVISGVLVSALNEALRRSKRREMASLHLHAATLASLGNPVVAYDQEGHTIFVNPAFVRVFGWQPEELLGRRIPFVPEDQQEASTEVIAQVYETGGMATLETKRLTKDGKLLEVMISAAAVLDESGQPSGMVVNITDVTQTRQLQAQLQQAQKMEAIGILAGGIAHDFNNILAVLVGFTELAQQKAHRGQPNLRELDNVMEAIERARSLVTRILTFSRRKEAEFKPLNLNTVVRETLELLRPSLPKMIAIEPRLDPGLQLINADHTQLEQVIMNLVTNAADAMPEGGQLVIETKNVVLDKDYRWTHLEVSPGNYVLLMLSDNGQGIEPTVLEQIFDPFFTTKPVGKGTGLGLSTVFGIVKGHGGQVNCYSEPGMGTTFKVYLPAHQPEGGIVNVAPALLDPLPGGTETVLLVDDEQSLREVGSCTLKDMGYRVITACNGEEALDIYRAQDREIDVVVMDLGMPVMGGHRCLQEVLAINPQARVIIASGYSANGQVKASLESGALGYVAKPFRRTELLIKVRQVLDRSDH
ncbi:MAG: ATP-binding protein [Pseudomonadota bacterium]